MGRHLFRSGIRQCIDLNYATAQHQTIWEHSPRGRGAEDYERFVEFVISGEQESHGIKEKAEAVVQRA